MGDLLPPFAAERRSLARAVLREFELYGYSLVTAPAFEHAEAIERGLETMDPRELLRFVDPDSGEVAVLRPDITPQVARIVASRLRDTPGPFRLCYDGRVIRRRRGRARRHKQISQVGVELVGWPSPGADTEIITLAHHACTRVGLRDFRVELSHVSLAHSLLADVPDLARPQIVEALARKDVAAIDALARGGHVSADTRKRLRTLAGMHGDVAILERATSKLKWRHAQQALRTLRDIASTLSRRGLDGCLGVDLSETRGSSYYTGVSFSLLAEGPGEALGGGGRYDNLIARYGDPAPATGFALDLENLQWALRHAAVPPRGSEIVTLALSAAAPRERDAAAEILRRSGIGVAVIEASDATHALAFARAWSYAGALILGRDGAHGLRTYDGRQRRFADSTWNDPRELRAWFAAPRSDRDE